MNDNQRIIIGLILIVIISVLLLIFGHPLSAKCWLEKEPWLCQYKLEGVCK